MCLHLIILGEIQSKRNRRIMCEAPLVKRIKRQNVNFIYSCRVIIVMKLYKKSWYPEKKIEVSQMNVVDILTLEESSSVRHGYYDVRFERQKTRSFAVNYAWERGDRSPVLRGFEFNGKLYEIDSQEKRLLVQPASGQLFYDEDKIEENQFVFEGNLDEFVAEFIKAGYRIEDK